MALYVFVSLSVQNKDASVECVAICKLADLIMEIPTFGLGNWQSSIAASARARFLNDDTNKIQDQKISQ